MKPRKQSVLKWTAALRSGQYKQTEGYLQDSEGHCCLGVACELFIPKSKQRRFTDSGFLVGGLPDLQDEAPKWLVNIDSDFGELSKKQLSILNDSDFTFDEIADLLEAVYVHEALT